MKLLLVFCLMVCGAASGAQVGSLTGVVHDEQGAAIAGALVTITSEAAHSAFSTTSDASGAYHFISLPAGAYRLQTAHDGFVSDAAVDVSIAAGAEGSVALRLRRAARPQFEAAGVRGLIDPGGYSASSNAAAASGLIKGIADIKRTGNDATMPAMSTSCGLEPALLRDVQQRPESVAAHLKLGEFYLAHGQGAKAVPLLEHAQTLDGNDQEVLAQLADAYLRTGRFEAARQLLTSAKVQESPAMYRLLARADEGAGRFSDASHAYQLAAGGDPSEENLFGVAYELILAGLPRDAEQAFAAAVKRVPRSIQLRIGLGSAQFLLGHTAEAIRTLLQAVEMDPADPRAYSFLLSAASTAHDEAEQVQAAFERFLTLAPENPRASYYLALVMLHQPAAYEVTRRRRIEGLLKHAILLDPNLADAHLQLGVLYAREGEYEPAAHELEQEIRISPDSKEAHYRLALAYRQLGQLDASAKQMQLFRELQAQSPAAKVGMGVDVDQFISVLGKPSPVAGGESLCPGDSP